jgi:two-component system chemotaxis response regulator CheB
MSIRVLVVDDSATARRAIEGHLAREPDIEVVGSAGDPLEASEKIEALLPDVMTLDLELPKMDGLTFLRSLMRHHPMPVVIVSAYTQKGSRLAMEALEAGAVEIVPKPGGALSVAEMSAELVAKVRAASQARMTAGAGSDGRPDGWPAAVPAALPAAVPGGGVRPGGPARAPGAAGVGQAAAVSAVAARRRVLAQEPVRVLPPLGRPVPPERMIAIGSSTGGTQALQYILMRLPADMPPILIVQHMPPGFTNAFAGRLNQLCALEVKEAAHNDTVLPGHVYVAPGGLHMVLRRTGGRYWVEVMDGPRVCRQKPSVEVLFQSVAKLAGKTAIGAILTGMGGDGAEGMLALRQAGAETIAEDEKSCVVFGMPKEAIKLGGVKHVVHLHHIADKLHKLA